MTVRSYFCHLFLPPAEHASADIRHVRLSTATHVILVLTYQIRCTNCGNRYAIFLPTYKVLTMPMYIDGSFHEHVLSHRTACALQIQTLSPSLFHCILPALFVCSSFPVYLPHEPSGPIFRSNFNPYRSVAHQTRPLFS